MLRPFAHPVACWWMLLRVVVQSLKPVKLFSQQLPTFLLFRDRRSVAQQCWIRLHSFSNTVEAAHAHNALFSQRLMCCILPTMHCWSHHCWELLHPFANYCQHARNNSQHCWRINFGRCCVHPFVQDWGLRWGFTCSWESAKKFQCKLRMCLQNARSVLRQESHVLDSTKNRL